MYLIPLFSSTQVSKAAFSASCEYCHGYGLTSCCFMWIKTVAAHTLDLRFANSRGYRPARLVPNLILFGLHSARGDRLGSG